MAVYEYLVQDLATGEPLADLPLSCNSLPRAISSDASTTFTLDIGDERVRKLDPRTATEPGRTALFALRDGVPVWGGIIWGRTYQAATTTLTIQASTVESYWRHRYWTKGNWFTTADQFLLGAIMVTGTFPVVSKATTWQRSDGTTFVGFTDIATETDSDGTPLTINTVPHGIQTPYTWDGATLTGPTCGVSRTVQFLPGKNVYDAMLELMGLENGFEWTCDPVQLPDGTYGWTSRFGFSQLGRHEDLTGIEFNYTQGLYRAGVYEPGLGSNIIDYEYTEDATTSADRVVVTGAETDAYVPYAVRGDLSLLNVGYPLLEVGTSYGDVPDTDTLAALASGALKNAAMPSRLASWTVRGDGDFGFGTFQMGDRAAFAVSDLFTPRQTDGVAGRLSVERIVSWSLAPEQRGQPERVTLTTNPIEMASPRLPKSEARRLEQFERQLRGQTITSRQGNSPTAVTHDLKWITVPNQGAGTPGATVTVTDLIFTKTAPNLRLSYNTVVSGQGIAPEEPFIEYHVIDVNTGSTFDNFFIGAQSDITFPFDARVIGLSGYDYGDRVTLRVTAFMQGIYGTPVDGVTRSRVESAQQTN